MTPVIATVSGIDGSGKTVFARGLAAELGPRAVLLHVDDSRRQVEWAQPGRTEAEIYHDDYFALDELDARVRAQSADVVLVEGTFVLRVPSLATAFSIYLDVDVATAEARVLARDVARGRTVEDVRHRLAARYRPAQERYLAECRPRERADLVIDNNRAERPRLLRGDPISWPALLAAPLGAMLGLS
jgi:uridine kinase